MWLYKKNKTNLFFQMVEDKLDNDVVLHLKDLIDPLGDPGLEDIHLHLGHVHLDPEVVLKLHRLEELLLLVGEAVVLIRGGSSEETGIGHVADLI